MGVKIPTLQRNIPITKEDLPSEEFHIWWQNVAKSLTNTIDAQNQQITDIQSALNSANQAKRSLSRINSYTVPSNVLTAADAGSSVTVAIAGHTRVYPDDAALPIPDVTISPASLTGLAYSTKYYVYYDDSTLSDTTPSFLTTTDAAVAQVGAGSSRHFVGVITTPASGGGSTGGGGGAPPGGGGGPLP